MPARPPRQETAHARPGRGAPTQSVTLRVRTAHLAELDRMAADLGIIRSAAIQLAIGEFIARRRGTSVIASSA